MKKNKTSKTKIKASSSKKILLRRRANPSAPTQGAARRVPGSRTDAASSREAETATGTLQRAYTVAVAVVLATYLLFT